MYQITEKEMEMTVAWLRSCRIILEALPIGRIGRWIFGKRLQQVTADLTAILDLYEKKRYAIREA